MEHRNRLRALLAGVLTAGALMTASANPPTDYKASPDGDPQQSVNEHAWSTFLSLMRFAAADQRGVPAEPGQARSTARVWETYKEQYEVYMPDGSAPPAWNAPQPTPQACAGARGGHLFRDEKVDDMLDATLQAVKADGTLPGTLKDLNGNVVRYEIRMNRTVFDYIVDNGLYNGEVQGRAVDIDYPDGSIIIKAAWKELAPQESGERFVTRDACVCAAAANGDPEQCRVARTGLVGFHVMHKTPSAPQWIWSTFEHVANTVPSHGLPALFNNPECTGPHCVPNSQTPDDGKSGRGVPNQVVQLLPIAEELRHLNDFVEFVVGIGDPDMSVLANYQLMSAQWPTSNTDLTQPKTVFTVAPTFSANTTMETFAQSSSSCMGCHAMSRGLNPERFVSGDFTFTLNNAMPKPAGAICGDYDYANSVFCGDELILFNPEASPSAAVQRGHALISQTYEEMPTNVGNKLHCQSCHLHGGGDPNASWWVGMRQPGAYPQTADLQNRINGCFKRSMAGFPLCTPGEDCDNNADMSAIIAYMDWLSAAYEAEHGCRFAAGDCPTPARGFPALTASVKGDPHAGEAIYQQKCAFCHNDLGEGRYESDTYFRPALWGPNSYKDDAGMAQASLLARFLRWNMPYTSGGLLTDQEAQDLACFIDAQQRPGKLTYGSDEPGVCQE